MPILNMVGGGNKGGNIGEPLNLTVTASGLDATITWEDNEIGTIPPTTFQKSELVRKIGSAPTSPSDGTLVVTETVKDTYKVSGYVDQGLTDGTTYYYRVFSYSDLGGISYCDAVSVTPSGGGWQPGANTLAYYPFIDDDDDIIGGTSLSASGTQKTIGRAFSSNVMINNFPSSSVRTASVWLNVETLTGTGNSQVFILRTQPGCYMVKDSLHTGAFYMYKNTNYYEDAPRTQGQWTHLVITVVNNYLVCYQDGTQYTLGNGSLQDAYNQLVNVAGTCSFILSDLIFEDIAWTQQEVQDYYDATKGNYGIS